MDETKGQETGPPSPAGASPLALLFWIFDGDGRVDCLWRPTPACHDREMECYAHRRGRNRRVW